MNGIKAGKKTLDVAMMAKIALFTGLITLGGFIRIPLPHVPFTLQILFTTLAGLILGSYGGALASGVYVLLGLAGFPVFTAGGGPGYVFYPTFGYLIGFIVGAWAAGKIVETHRRSGVKTYFIGAMVNLLIVYLCGCAYLFIIKNLYLGEAMAIGAVLYAGFLLPVPGDLFLMAVSAPVAKRVREAIR